MTNPHNISQPIHENESLTLLERSRLSLRGITDVVSFDESAVVLEIKESVLTIEGETLHISKLSLSEGIVEVEGRVNALYYTEGKWKQKTSFWKRWGK